MTLRQTFLRALAFGLPGIVILALVTTPPAGIPRMALAINPFFLLILMSGIGAFTVKRTGLKSALLRGDAIDLQATLRWGGIAIGAGVALAIADQLATPFWRAEGATQPQTLAEAASLSGLALGLTYGGVTEELMMRWGLMAGVMALAMRWATRDNAAAIGCTVAALLFALGHLPALALAGVAPTPEILSRIILINAGLGFLFGWLFLQRDLETAIAAHAGVHVGAFAAGLVIA